MSNEEYWPTVVYFNNTFVWLQCLVQSLDDSGTRVKGTENISKDFLYVRRTVDY